MDFLNSFFQNIKDKLTSPFFGTLSFILLVHHWEFWYTLFNFDNGTGLTEKLSILRMVGSREFTLKRIIVDIVWAVSIMLTGYVIVLLTRSLSLWVDFRAMPWITGKIISKNVVERHVHEEVLNERDEYAEKYEEQRQFVRKYSKEYDDQVDQVQEKNLQVSQLNAAITELNNQVKSLNSQLSSRNSEFDRMENDCRMKDLNINLLSDKVGDLENSQKILRSDMEHFNTIFFSGENHDFYRSRDKFPPTILTLVKRLKTDGQWERFKKVANYERYAGVIGIELYPVMEQYGIIVPSTERLTSLGRILATYYEIFDQE